MASCDVLRRWRCQLGGLPPWQQMLTVVAGSETQRGRFVRSPDASPHRGVEVLSQGGGGLRSGSQLEMRLCTASKQRLLW